MINSLNLPGELAETWGAVYARLVARMGALAYNPGFKPRLYAVPQWTDRVLGQDQAHNQGGPYNTQLNGYVKVSMVVTPGSFIWGLLYAPFFVAGAVKADYNFVVQITDVSLRHKWFSEPVPADFFRKAPGVAVLSAAQCSKVPWLLEAPYPVTGTGLFVVEFWNTSIPAPTSLAANDCQRWVQMAFATAEPNGGKNGK